MEMKEEQQKRSERRRNKPVSASRKLAAERQEQAARAPKKPQKQLMAEFADEAFGTDDLKMEAVTLPKKHAKAKGKEKPPTSRRNRSKHKYKYKKTVWWAMPLCVSMSVVLLLSLSFVVREIHGYAKFIEKKQAVNRQTFYPGVTANGVDLSGLTLEEALQEFAEQDEQARNALDITMRLKDKGWQTNAETLGYQSDYKQVLLAAWAVGRYGTLDERYQVVSSLGDENWRRDFRIQDGIDETLAVSKLTDFAESLSTPVVNSSVEYFDEANRTFTFTESREGQVVHPKELLEGIRHAASTGAKTVNIIRHEEKPKDTPMTLSQTYGEIASATTDASSSSPNRIANIKKACEVLNGLRIEPGETFSFNKTLGPRTAKKGYRPAPAYENGITTNQIGGGICQVSTTLFNAVAKADLKITARSPHSRPSSYIGIGKDAAVNWPNQDFKFRNTTRYPVYIAAGVSKKWKVTVSVFGRKLLNGMSIQLDSERTATIPAGRDKVSVDPKLASGEKVVVEAQRKGYRAVVYKVYLDANGKPIKREELAKSYYAASGAIIRVGP